MTEELVKHNQKFQKRKEEKTKVLKPKFSRNEDLKEVSERVEVH